MLYLAEVKKQTKGFIGGFKTEFKLLVCQHNDQTWSVVPGEEIVSTEDLNQAGDGALFLLNLGNNRQIQGKPELAGAELVRQLQKLSRLLEKTKDQREEIDQWKQSLTYQSQELTRREMEMESRLEQMETMEQEFQELTKQRQEIEEAWERLQKEQQSIEAGHREVQESKVLASEQTGQFQEIITRLSSSVDGAESLWEQLNRFLEVVNSQQGTLDSYWQQLEQQRSNVEHKQREVDQQYQDLNNRKQELHSAQTSLEQAKIQLQLQQNVLSNKQDLLGYMNLNLQTLEELQGSITRLAIESGNIQLVQKVDIEALENMPLGELQEIINNLQADLDKIVLFVNDQEEELTLQSQAVQELKEKLEAANDYDRLSIEGELTEEKERKKMLDQTLIGQRRNLRDRQEVLLQHLRVLRRRQGLVDADNSNQKINLEPILLQLEEQQNNANEEKQRLETEIEHLQKSLQQIKEMIEQQDAQQQRKTKELQAQEENCQQAKIAVAQLQSRVSMYEEILQPMQDRLNEIRHKFESISQLLVPLQQMN